MAIEIRNTTEHLLSENPNMAKDINLLRRNDLLSKGVGGSKTISGAAAQTAAAWYLLGSYDDKRHCINSIYYD